MSSGVQCDHCGKFLTYDAGWLEVSLKQVITVKTYAERGLWEDDKHFCKEAHLYLWLGKQVKVEDLNEEETP